MDRRTAARRRKASCAGAFALSLWTCIATPATAGSEFAIRQRVFANGGGFISDDCYRLLAVIGQPVLGSVGSKEFTLTSGYLSDAPSTDDKIFRSGFESGTGACK